MGKKRIIAKSKEELLKETDKVEQKLKKEVKVKSSKRLRQGRIYIKSSYNNTIITLTDEKGGVLAWASAGNIGFKGTKKATPFAASKVAARICESAEKLGVKDVEVFVKGVGSGRESAVRALAAHGMNLLSIKDATPIPHNGCRPPKTRRV